MHHGGILRNRKKTLTLLIAPRGFTPILCPLFYLVRNENNPWIIIFILFRQISLKHAKDAGLDGSYDKSDEFISNLLGSA